MKFSICSSSSSEEGEIRKDKKQIKKVDNIISRVLQQDEESDYMEHYNIKQTNLIKRQNSSYKNTDTEVIDDLQEYKLPNNMKQPKSENKRSNSFIQNLLKQNRNKEINEHAIIPEKKPKVTNDLLNAFDSQYRTFAQSIKKSVCDDKKSYNELDRLNFTSKTMNHIEKDNITNINDIQNKTPDMKMEVQENDIHNNNVEDNIEDVKEAKNKITENDVQIMKKLYNNNDKPTKISECKDKDSIKKQDCRENNNNNNTENNSDLNTENNNNNTENNNNHSEPNLCNSTNNENSKFLDYNKTLQKNKKDINIATKIEESKQSNNLYLSLKISYQNSLYYKGVYIGENSIKTEDDYLKVENANKNYFNNIVMKNKPFCYVKKYFNTFYNDYIKEMMEEYRNAKIICYKPEHHVMKDFTLMYKQDNTIKTIWPVKNDIDLKKVLLDALHKHTKYEATVDKLVNENKKVIYIITDKIATQIKNKNYITFLEVKETENEKLYIFKDSVNIESNNNAITNVYIDQILDCLNSYEIEIHQNENKYCIIYNTQVFEDNNKKYRKYSSALENANVEVFMQENSINYIEKCTKENFTADFLDFEYQQGLYIISQNKLDYDGILLMLSVVVT